MMGAMADEKGFMLMALRRADPPAWKARIKAVMRAHGSKIADVAAELEVGLRTLKRWLAEDALRDVPRGPGGRLKPQDWKTRLNAAMREHEGNVTRVAKELGVAERTVRNWLAAKEAAKSA